MRLEVFIRKQQSGLMSIARHNVYNANRVLVRMRTNQPPDDRFLRKLKTSETSLQGLEDDVDLFAEFPKELLYRVEHLALLIRAVNIDAEYDSSASASASENELYYKRMLRRFMTIAVLSDKIELYLSQSKKCHIASVSWGTLIGKARFVIAPPITMDSRISEVEDLNVAVCHGLFVKYINQRHIEQLEGNIGDHIAYALDYPKVRVELLSPPHPPSNN